MNGSLSFISTDLETPLEVYDEMKHMFSGDFWRMRKHKIQCSVLILVLIFSEANVITPSENWEGLYSCSLTMLRCGSAVQIQRLGSHTRQPLP